MNHFTEQIYMGEILKQSNRAINCYNQIQHFLSMGLSEELFCEIEHFLHHAAISLLLWPSPSNNTKNKSYTLSRGKSLRKKLGLNSSSPLSKRILRNHLVHFDERLDDWASLSKHHNFIDQNIENMSIAITGVDSKDIIRNFDPTTNEMSFMGKKFNLNDIYSAIFQLKDSLNN